MIDDILFARWNYIICLRISLKTKLNNLKLDILVKITFYVLTILYIFFLHFYRRVKCIGERFIGIAHF